MAIEPTRHPAAPDPSRLLVPAVLRDAGVKVVSRDGVRGVVIPEAVKQQVNVLLAVEQLAQADPNWTPRFNVVTLDPQTHGYSSRDTRVKVGSQWKDGRAPNKLGLLALADAAGLPIETRRMGPNEVRAGELGWVATVEIRQSDGTTKRISASKIVDVEFEREVIHDQCINEQTGAVDEARARKRWLTERPHFEAKAETKAVERAIRAALQIPHALTEDHFRRPWLVIGWSYTPDYADPMVRSALLERALGARGALYPVEHDQPAAGELAAPPSDEPEDVDAELVEPEAGHEATPEPEAPPPARAPSERRAEPAAAPHAATHGETPDWVTAAGDTRFPGGKYKGQSIRAVAEGNQNYLRWLVQQDGRPGQDDPVKEHARAYLRAIDEGLVS